MKLRNFKRKIDESGGGKSPAEPQNIAAPPTRRFRGWRGWVLRLLLLFLSPVLFLGLIEVGLRVTGYGYPTAFFIKLAGGDAYRTNNQFGWRFFPANLARPPEPCVVAPKPVGAIRIFVLGSSAAQGIPGPAYSFGRILEVMLRERYPGVRFEVVNAAMTAINSHVALEIAGDCVPQGPDLFIVYMGNNEVVGPYGPGTVFQKWSPSLRVIRGSVRMKSMRIGQLAEGVFGLGNRDQNTPAQWRGMEMFLNNQVAADDPRLSSVYDNLRHNLTDICRTARSAGTAVILSTVATNLKDCPPFASAHRAGLSAEELAKWEAAYQEGARLETAGKRSEAMLKYGEAARIDDRFAEMHFRMARCLASDGKSTEAKGQFVLARDLDTLRFRADSRINDVIRKVAAESRSAGVQLLDAEQALSNESLSPGGIPGENLFYEHVHLTFDGNYQLARAMLDTVSAALPQLDAFRALPPLDGPRQESLTPTRQKCAASLALSPWDELEMARYIAEMTSRAPFTNQLDHSTRQGAAGERMIALERLAMKPESMLAAAKLYSAALEKAPGDWQLRSHMASLALQAGRPDVAAKQLRIVLEQFPWEASLHNKLGIALARMGKSAEAMESYEQALRITPEDSQTHSNLGNVLRQVGRVPEAIEHYEQALRLKPDNAEAHNNFGNVLQQSGRIPEAIGHFEEALRIRPENADAHNNLANVLVDAGRVSEGIGHYEKALRIHPENVAAHFNLGMALEQTDRRADAIKHYEEALRLNPQLTPARERLSSLRGKKLP